jgi:hypothetical protein
MPKAEANRYKEFQSKTGNSINHIKIMSIQLFFRLKFYLYSCINKNLMRLICIALKKIN